MPDRVHAPAVLAAIVARLRATAAIAALLGASPIDQGPGVYEDVAPEQAPLDFLVVSAGLETPYNTYGPEGSAKWGGVVAVTVRATARSAARAKGLGVEVRGVLGAVDLVLAIAGYTDVDVEPGNAGPLFVEESRGEWIYHYPAEFRVTVHE